MLLTKNINNSLVIHINIKGIKKIDENPGFVFINVSAGENWHDFILWCIDNNYGGLENMSLIPGNVGTAPIQNIGAYGTELKDNFIECEAIEIETGIIKSFSKIECEFDYRNSVFKNKLKGKYIITSVTFKLTKKNHILNTAYGVIEKELEGKNILSPTIKDISNAVIAIRKSKLPDPKKIGNSGSFFKNPVISSHHFQELKNKFPELPHYVISENSIKIPAGWLIEQSGFKGKRFGNYGVHEKQALVLVNYDNATGKNIYQLAQRIQETIKSKFSINLEIEVNVI
jgi:UDP-N-acetylmuramate dehydrogenase